MTSPFTQHCLPSFLRIDIHTGTAKRISTKIWDRWAPFFGIYTKTKCWLGGGEPKWLTTTAPGLKWRTVSPLITSPECDKNQLLKSIHDTFFAPLILRRALLPSCPSNLLGAPWARTKMVEVYLLYFYYCFVVQDVQEMSPASVIENTGECANALWAWKVVLSFYCRHRTLNLPFFFFYFNPPPSLATFIILTKNPPFYVERFLEESQTLIQYVWAQMPPDLIVLVSLFMLSANAPLNHLDCCWILREFKHVKLRHKDLSAWMLRICVQHTT